MSDDAVDQGTAQDGERRDGGCFTIKADRCTTDGLDAGNLQKHGSGLSPAERQQFRTCPDTVIIGDACVRPQDDPRYSRTHAVDGEV